MPILFELVPKHIERRSAQKKRRCDEAASGQRKTAGALQDILAEHRAEGVATHVG
jgi:hypothetical protein